MTREEAIKALRNKIDTMRDGAICCNYGNDEELFEMAIKALEQQPCDDAISRQSVLDQTYLWSKDEFLRVTNPFDYLRKKINSLPPVTPKGVTVTDFADRCRECGAKNYKLLEHEPCEDAISRQYLLDNCVVDKVTMPYVPISKIQEAPPITPQSKTGYWIEEDMFDGDVAYRCSKCDELFWIECGTPKDNDYNFCPNCGAKMESEV